MEQATTLFRHFCRYLPLCAAVVVCGCARLTQSPSQTKQYLGFLAFGDSGYSEEYLGFTPSLTREQYIKHMRRRWLKQGLQPDEFQLPPNHRIDGTEFFIHTSGLRPVAAAMESFCAAQPCDFALILGDNIYPDGAHGDADDPLRFHKILEQPFQRLAGGTRNFKLYATLGDHDWRSFRKGRDALLAYARRKDTRFQIEANGYYSFVRQNAEFFILETNLLLAGTQVFKAKLAPDGSEQENRTIDETDDWKRPTIEEQNQLSWFKKAISQSKADWKIVLGHHPLWSSGGRKFEQARALRKLLLPVLCDYADLYLAGHEHDLEVHLDHCSENDDKDTVPLPIIVSGAASKQRAINHRFERQQQRKYPYYETLWEKGMTWGFVHISLEPQQAVVSMVTTPNTATGVPVVEKTLFFPRRSGKARLIH